LALGMGSWLLERTGGLWRWFLLVTVVLIDIAALTGLVGSCSRGGWCAAIAACTLMACVDAGSLRRCAIAVMLSLLVAIALVPRAEGRLAFQENDHLDGSIASRFAVWSASASMIADRPGGWGSGQFEAVCDAWYLPHYRGVPMWHPLNDILMIATERGIIAAWAVLAFTFALVRGLVCRERCSGPWPPALAGVITALAVAGCFTSLLRPGGIAGYALAAGALGTLAWIWPGGNAHRRWPSAALGAAGAALVLAMVWMYGWVAASSLPWKPLSEVRAVPRNAVPVAAVVVVRAQDDTAVDICRLALRPLVAAGLDAEVFRLSTSGSPPTDLHERVHSAIIALHGCSADLARSLSLPGNWSPCGAILIDWDGTSADLPMPCPILALHGTAVPALSDAQIAALRSQHPQTQQGRVEAPICWPRTMHLLTGAIMAWLDLIGDDDGKAASPLPGRQVRGAN
jgi:hypothetical protein